MSAAPVAIEATLAKARSAAKRGDGAEAERHYAAILARFPRNPKALAGLDGLRRTRENAPAASIPQEALAPLVAAYEAGRLAEAATLAEALVARFPEAMLALNLLGVVRIGLCEWAAARAALERAIAQAPRQAALHNNLATALGGEKRHAEAEAAARAALALDPAYATGHNTLGNALKAQGHIAPAIAAYTSALELRPDYADAVNNLGVALQMASRFEEAIPVYRRALALNDQHAAAWNNLGSALAEAGDEKAAVEAFHRAIAITPLHAESWCNLGASLKRLERLEEAAAALQRALAIDPRSTAALNEYANVRTVEDRTEEAVQANLASLAIDPAQRWVWGNLWQQKRRLCDWSAMPPCPEADAEATISNAAQPFALLTLDDDPARHLAEARHWARARFAAPDAPLPPHPPAADGRIRIGYFSGDFHEHATMHLLAGLLRAHDRAAFEIHAFSYGKDHDDAMRAHARAHVDHFHDIRALPDSDAVALARAQTLDLAIDLKGYTFETRSRLFGRRLAPLQASWLGYPGTMGAPFIDYLIADAVVVPPELRAFYDEKIVALPGSYQPNDDTRALAEPGSRADHGLPENTFVFCCFNQSYKISPAEWDIWMRLLGAVPRAVLWLLKPQPTTLANLRREAAARGIDPARLIFAERAPSPRHLARQRHADLFLDTFAVGAHTTASDALWGGLPVLTLAGRAFPARVAASLVHAIGLGDMAVSSAAEYEALALALARDPARLADLRARLAAHHATQPLFDTQRHARALEAAYHAMVERQRAGLTADHLVIEEPAAG